MKCPKCGGKAMVTDTVHDLEANETYRRRKCTECGSVSYSVEFGVELDRRVRSIFTQWHALQWEHRRETEKLAKEIMEDMEKEKV